MTIQSILFKKKSWTPKKAEAWLKKHNYKPLKKVHKTENYLRYRISKPDKRCRYSTVKFNKSIQAVVKYC